MKIRKLIFTVASIGILASFAFAEPKGPNPVCQCENCQCEVCLCTTNDQCDCEK